MIKLKLSASHLEGLAELSRENIEFGQLPKPESELSSVTSEMEDIFHADLPHELDDEIWTSTTYSRKLTGPSLLSSSKLIIEDVEGQIAMENAIVKDHMEKSQTRWSNLWNCHREQYQRLENLYHDEKRRHEETIRMKEDNDAEIATLRLALNASRMEALELRAKAAKDREEADKRYLELEERCNDNRELAESRCKSLETMLEEAVQKFEKLTERCSMLETKEEMLKKEHGFSKVELTTCVRLPIQKGLDDKLHKENATRIKELERLVARIFGEHGALEK
jgi:hypothetical protein